MNLSAPSVRSATATRVVVATMLGVGLLAGCGGSDADELATDELGADELRAAIEQDRAVADDATRAVAPLLADTLGGRVLGASAAVEGCQGGSFDGATAYGYQVSGRIVGFRARDLLPAAEKVADALSEAGWSETGARETSPGRAGAEGSKSGVVLGVEFSENLPGAMFTVRGRCLPVTDAGRDSVADIDVPTYVIEKR